MLRDITRHGEQRFIERIGYATEPEIKEYINRLPPGNEVSDGRYRFVFATDKYNPQQQVLITVIPDHR